MSRASSAPIGPDALAAAAIGLVLFVVPTHAQTALIVTAEVSVTSLASKLPATGDGATIRPFHVHFPERALVELKRRIGATRWPDKEIVADDSQGVQLATMRELAR